jgi:hypothetical protein
LGQCPDFRRVGGRKHRQIAQLSRRHGTCDTGVFPNASDEDGSGGLSGVAEGRAAAQEEQKNTDHTKTRRARHGGKENE